MPLGIAHERLRVAARGEHTVVAGFGHHELVSDVGRARAEAGSAARRRRLRGSQYQETGSCDVARRKLRDSGEIGHRA